MQSNFLFKNQPFRLLASRQYNLIYGKNNKAGLTEISSYHKSAIVSSYLMKVGTFDRQKTSYHLNIKAIKYFNQITIKKSFICTSPKCNINSDTRDITKNNIINNNLARIEFINGLVKLVLYLPAKQERCEFTLRIYCENVGNLLDNIKNEDKSIEKAHFYSLDGTRIAQNTPLSQLVLQPFKIRLNDTYFYIEPPPTLAKSETMNLQTTKDLDELRHLISKLYLHLNIDELQRERELEMTRQLELLRNELLPMEKIKEELASKSKKHTNRMIWLGLGLMSCLLYTSRRG